MVHANSLYHLLESCSDREESYGSQSFVVEVFMAGTPPPRPSNVVTRDMAADTDAAIAHNVVAGGGQGGGMLLTAEQLHAVEELLNTPIPGDGPAERAIEVVHQSALAECTRLA